MTRPDAGLSSIYAWVKRQVVPDATSIGGKGIAINRIWDDRWATISGIGVSFADDGSKSVGEEVFSGSEGLGLEGDGQTSLGLGDVSLVMSISTDVYPFSANIPDQFAHL